MADLEARDLLEADMFRHETRFNGEVHASRNQALAAEALRELDRQRAVSPPSVAPEPVAQPDRFTQRRELNGHKYTLDKAPDTTPMYRAASDFEANVLRHAMPRIKRLLTERDSGPLGTPSWRVRVLAACYFKIKAHEAATSGRPGESDIFERAYQQDLYELLEASNQPFGDWRKSAPEKIQITIA